MRLLIMNQEGIYDLADAEQIEMVWEQNLRLCRATSESADAEGLRAFLKYTQKHIPDTSPSSYTY